MFRRPRRCPRDFVMFFKSAADTAGKAGERRVLVHQPRQQIFELRQLHLNLSLPAVGAVRKNIQDHLCPVKNFQPGEITDGTDLRGRHFVVEDQQICANLCGAQINIRQFAPANKIPWIRLRTILNLTVKNCHTAGFRQLPELF